jgi:hypothetical protein
VVCGITLAVSLPPIDVLIGGRAVLDEHFRNQLGLITRAQASAAGMSVRQIERRLASGQWIRVTRGVYRHAAWPVTYEQRVLAACRGLDHAAGSHATAGRLHALDGVQAGRVHVSVPRGFATRSRLATIHQATHLFVPDVVNVGPIPVTSVARTVVDLAATLPESRLVSLVDHVLVRRRTTIDEIGEAMVRAEDAPGRAGARRLIAALDAWTPGKAIPDSEPEMELVRAIEDRGLPSPDRQVPIFDVRGKQIATADVGYVPPACVAMEYDSTEFHGTPRAAVRDIARANRIVAAGWTLLVATALDRRNGFCALIDHLEAILARVMP